MIINDEHRFAFIHIPKCAGTYIRGRIENFDSRKNKYTKRVDHHPELGVLDYVHIPLFTLHDHFCCEFETVQQYWSFAVMRDPYTRFASSVSQNLRKYSEKPIHKRSVRDIDSCVRKIIDFLSCRGGGQLLLPPKYIHFQRQVDYIIFDGEQIIGSLYTVNQIDDLMLDINRHTGGALSDKDSQTIEVKANQTIVFRNHLLRCLVETFRPIMKNFHKFLPEDCKQKIRDQVYVPRDEGMRELFEADYIRGFIRDYYAEDIRLYRTLQVGSGSVST